MPDPDSKSIEVPEANRETAARIQQAARVAAYLPAKPVLLAEAEADQAGALARYVQEDYRAFRD
ncbi:MAG: hypothetical protein GY953_01350 [bacterium]|nr:hypothetical protein [bacterium]